MTKEAICNSISLCSTYLSDDDSYYKAIAEFTLVSPEIIDGFDYTHVTISCAWGDLPASVRHCVVDFWPESRNSPQEVRMWASDETMDHDFVNLTTLPDIGYQLVKRTKNARVRP